MDDAYGTRSRIKPAMVLCLAATGALASIAAFYAYAIPAMRDVVTRADGLTAWMAIGGALGVLALVEVVVLRLARRPSRAASVPTAEGVAWVGEQVAPALAPVGAVGSSGHARG